MLSQQACRIIVMQRGNRQRTVFFYDSDDECYRAMLAEGCRNAGVDVLGYMARSRHRVGPVKHRSRDVTVTFGVLASFAL